MLALNLARENFENVISRNKASCRKNNRPDIRNTDYSINCRKTTKLTNFIDKGKNAKNLYCFRQVYRNGLAPDLPYYGIFIDP